MCELCEAAKGKKVYEDEKAAVIVDSSPAMSCQLIIFPKAHYEKSGDIPPEELSHIYAIAGLAATSVFEVTGAAGTNLIAHDFGEHFKISVIPRKEGDGISLRWNAQSMSQDDMDAIAQRIKSEALLVGKKEFGREETIEKITAIRTNAVRPDNEEETIEEEPLKKAKTTPLWQSEPNYLLRQLRRMP